MTDIVTILRCSLKRLLTLAGLWLGVAMCGPPNLRITR